MNNDGRGAWILQGIAPWNGRDKRGYRTPRDWWRGYPEGLTLLREGQDLVGAMGLWPLGGGCWADLAAGVVTASQLNAGDLHADPMQCDTWFLSGIALRKYRHTQALPLLLGGAIERWALVRFAEQHQVVAIPMGAMGDRLLRRFGGRMQPLDPSAPQGIAARVVIQASTATLRDHLHTTLLPVGG